ADPRALLQAEGHCPVPRGEDPALAALPRRAELGVRRGDWAGALRRLRALRPGVPQGRDRDAHVEWTGWGAVRRLLRDPHHALLVLRALRRGVPVPRDRDEPRVRAVAVRAVRPGLHSRRVARPPRRARGEVRWPPASSNRWCSTRSARCW